ncbi:DUF4280 domain-containing protein [Citrobacter sp. VF227]
MSCPAVCNGAMLECSFGIAPAALNVLPTSRTIVNNLPMANIMDNKPFLNILPFGMCNSLANPTVAAATAAAFGMLTPMPCIPTIIAPWMPGSTTTMIGNTPALTMQSQLMCACGGVIQIRNPGQVTTLLV